jgi:hypothetical protein
MTNKRELEKIAKEIKSIKARLNKTSEYDWDSIIKQSQKVGWYDVKEYDEELQLGYYTDGDYPDVSAYIYVGAQQYPDGFYVEVLMNEFIGEENPMLAKKLSKVRGVNFADQWGVNFEAKSEDALSLILKDLEKVLSKEL